MIRLNLKRVWSLVAVVILLVFFNAVGVLQPAKNAFILLLNPFNHLSYSLSQNFNSGDNSVSSNPANDLLLLQEKNKILIAENAKLKALEDENQALREQLHFLSTVKYKYILADVVSRDISSGTNSAGQFITLDRGQADGLKEGLVIVDNNGTAVGKITNVDDHLAQACLVTTTGCQLAATIQNQERTMGITDGELGLTIKMSYIPQAENIKIGDNVVTSGLGGDIPRGLVIGQVAQINKDSNEIWQNAVIESTANLNNLIFVSVLAP